MRMVFAVLNKNKYQALLLPFTLGSEGAIDVAKSFTRKADHPVSSAIGKTQEEKLYVAPEMRIGCSVGEKCKLR